MKYIDADKLISEIEGLLKLAQNKEENEGDFFFSGEIQGYKNIITIIDSLQQDPRFPLYDNIVEKVFGAGNLEGWERDEAEMLVVLAKEELLKSLQQEQPVNMIQWTGSNLQEVINFTGKSPKFGEWFKSWDEFESYVHSHGDILKLFSDDGSHFEVPVGAWIVKTPDGYNVPSVARFIQAKQEQPQLPGIEDPGIPGKDFIPVEWVDACEMYGKWKIVKLDQPELPGYDKALLEVKSKVDELYEEASIGLNEYDAGLYNGIAETCMKLRGFIKARTSKEQPEGGCSEKPNNLLREQPEVDLEKAAQHVYESWMGGTMDDVRRDMVDLGKVLNARKEE